jgi:hypothetical protein
MRKFILKILSILWLEYEVSHAAYMYKLTSPDEGSSLRNVGNLSGGVYLEEVGQ